MRKAGWLRDSVFGCTFKGDFNCIFQETFITDRYENRFYVAACSDNCADNFISVFERAVSPFFGGRFIKASG